MDRALRRLQKIAAQGGLEAQLHYIAALERIVGGGDAEESEYLGDANIASCDVPPEEAENVYRDIELLNCHALSDASGNRMGFMVEVHWEDSFGDDEIIEEIESQLSEFTKALMIEAANAGYYMIAFWH